MSRIAVDEAPSRRPVRPSFLEVRDLKVHFPTDDGLVKAVDGLSFPLERGKTLGIVGESGSGKSVTSLGILGPAPTGATPSVRRDLAGRRGADRRRTGAGARSCAASKMAMIFQDPLSAMHPYYTVGTQIVEAYRVHNDVTKKAARERAIEMLGRVGIPQPDRRVDDYPHQFSGGMRQRAMIAMALVMRPRAADRRRADHRARRDRAGADPRPDPGPAAGVRLARSSSSPTTSAWSPSWPTTSW